MARSSSSSSPVDVAFEKVSAIGLGLPGGEVKLSHGAPSFHVRGKMFMIFANDHHGVGRIAVWCKSTFEAQRRLLAEDSARFFVPPYVGVKGWVGVWLDHPRTDWLELAILAEAGWLTVAPKSVVNGAAKPAVKAAVFRRPTTDAKKSHEAQERLTAICAALSNVDVERAPKHATYRVGKKAFAYFLDNHHGDEIISACVRTPKGENGKLANEDAKRFYLPAYIGSKGWLGVRLERGRVDWEDVARRVAASYALVAPKRLGRTDLRDR